VCVIYTLGYTMLVLTPALFMLTAIRVGVGTASGRGAPALLPVVLAIALVPLSAGFGCVLSITPSFVRDVKGWRYLWLSLGGELDSTSRLAALRNRMTHSDADRPFTVILASHEVGEVEKVATHLLLPNHVRRYAFGTTAEVLKGRSLEQREEEEFFSGDSGPTCS
jgi:hypothetical protein